MARLSAKSRGKEVGRFEGLTYRKAYFENGDILINRGNGWKEFAKVKAGFNTEEVLRNKLTHQKHFLEINPAYAAYRKALHEVACLGKRWMLHEAIKLMPSDPDGVWSEVGDGSCDKLDLSINEVCDLCKLYISAEEEAANSGRIF